MQNRYPLLVVLSVLIVALTVWVGLRALWASGLPFAVERSSAHTLRAEALRGIPLPQGLHAGTVIDVRAQGFEARNALLASLAEGETGAGLTIDLLVDRAGRRVAVPFTTRPLAAVPELRLAYYLAVLWAALLGLTALVTLWRGRDWGAWGIALWATAFQGGVGLTAAPLSGPGLLTAAVAAPFLFLLARVGFYIMAEAIAARALAAPTRRLLRWCFVVFLLLGFAYEVAFPLLFVVHAVVLPQGIATLWAVPYLLAAAALLFGYRRADAELRQRLRWMFWSALVFTVGIQLSNVPVLGYPASIVVKIATYAVGIAGLLYAVLRHRLVDMTFVVNRALVYSATLTIVIAIFTLLESFVEEIALPDKASLILELGVPLAVGFSLDAVRKRIEHASEWLFFRRKFKAEAALRSYAHHCAYIEHPDHLVEQTLLELTTHTGARRAVLYWRSDGGYDRVAAHGDHAYPQRVDADDRAPVALRAERRDLDLEDLGSSLGSDGLMLPMIVHGELLGAMVVANRPGEHYPADERELLRHVVHEVGAALHALHARENARLIAELAGGRLSADAASERARALAQSF
jgi:hypothetical protein